MPGGREGRRSIAWPLRAGLTIAQVACAVLLVIAAGLLLRSLWTLTRVDPGFRPGQIVTAVVSPTESVCGTPERCLAFYRAFEEKVQAASSVRGAALVNTLPLTGAVAKRSLEIEGYKAGSPLFWLHTITPDYFRVMDIRIETGRAFTREDASGGAPVAIVTSATAHRFWPGQSPLGRHVRFVGEPHWHTIVGVVTDVRAFRSHEERAELDRRRGVRSSRTERDHGGRADPNGHDSGGAHVDGHRRGRLDAATRGRGGERSRWPSPTSGR
jgi:hypothetical protein